MFDLQEFLGVCGVHIPDHGPQGARGVSFASGSNRSCEVMGFCAAGIPPGLAATELLTKKGEPKEVVTILERLGDTGMPVFVDSGAFGAFKSGTEISERGWEDRFALYERLARALGPQLYVVAPDKIADQGATLDLLLQHASAVRKVAALGAQVLLPMQPGGIPLDRFLEAARAALGVPVIPAFPMREGITKPETVVAFVEDYQPEKIHLLGLGAANRETQELLEALWEVKPDLFISQDSMILKSRIGTKLAPRRYDEVNALSKRVFCDDLHGDVALWGESWAYTDEIGDPSQWLTPKRREQVAREALLTPDEAGRFQKDPTAFVTEEWDAGLKNYERPPLEMALEAAWEQEVHDRTGQERRAWSIPKAFEDHPAAHQFPGAPERAFLADLDPGRGFDVAGQLALVAEVECLVASRRASSRERAEIRRFASMPPTPLFPAEEPMLVIIPCGARKAQEPRPARDLYQGSMFAMGLKAAESLRARHGGQILILSGKHGLVQLDQVLEPYEQRMGAPGCISPEAIRAQAAAQGLLGPGQEVVVLAGKDYAGPARAVWPGAKTPLVGLGGIGYQRQALSRIIQGSDI